MTTFARTPIAADPEAVFDRDRFLLRQKLIAINQKYTVSDESGQPILHVVRPTYPVLGGLILLFTLIGIIAVIIGSLVIADAAFRGRGPHITTTQVVAFLLMLTSGVAFCILLAVTLYPKRHITFYLDTQKQHPVLCTRQGSKWELFAATYTVESREGEPLAILKKNYLWNLIRRRWRILDPGGQYIALALEDSWAKSVLRRVLGNWGALIRTNFNILTPTGEQIGAFNRNFTILDKYVLDMSLDTDIVLDRRVALALGVMLDTGERR